jgi:tRNA pseudouridine55 synthase
MNGFLVVDKPQGLTSHDIVARIRRGTHIKRVGHAGTLDPMATGVLVVCVGAATRLSEYVMASPKYYAATVRLGVETDTYDAEGQIMTTAPVDHLTRETVEQALTAFQGELNQVPPMYSAIKQGGKKLYELARKGETVERPARRIWMEVSLLDFVLPDIQLGVACSPGTYIRSLAHDLGAALGLGGHLVALRRLRSGGLDNPVPWDTFMAAMDDNTWTHYLIDERAALPGLPAFTLDATQAQDVLHGRQVICPDLIAEGQPCRAYTPEGQFIAILERQGERWQPLKVFPTESED